MSVVLKVAMVLVLSACASAVTRNPVPLDRLDDATIPNMPSVRDWVSVRCGRSGLLAEGPVTLPRQRNAKGAARRGG